MNSEPSYGQFFRVLIPGLLMTVYLAALWHKGPAHYFHHSQTNSEIHHGHCETDACHLAIYHGDLVHGCDHKAHIVEVHEKCHSCHEIFVPQNIHELCSNDEFEKLIYTQPFLPVRALLSPRSFSHSDRGPPVIC